MRASLAPAWRMKLLHRLRFFLQITRAQGIVRRYFVTNGFDGALAMLGLLMGFYLSGGAALSVVLSACLGAAIALGMSGLSSAYMSESAERKRAIQALEHAMVADLGESAHGVAARYVPVVIALVNGVSPLVIALIIIAPLWLGLHRMWLWFGVIESAIAIAFGVIFLLGVFLGKVSGTFWLWSGIRAVVVALVTVGLIVLVEQSVSMD